MSAESPAEKLRDVKRISFYECETPNWIGEIAQVLGDPKYKQLPEDDPDTMQEIAVYYLHSGNDVPDNSETVLTVIHNLRDDLPFF